MPQIKILPELLRNQIAAGEVVERPASVVKELVENALDAEATQVTVEIKQGGKTYIRVADNGTGMERADARQAFERYATSKIHTLHDLSRIQSFGFRGEALASVAAVAKVALKTKKEQDLEGTLLEISGGKIDKIEPLGFVTGTEIVVTDLFYNTPARRKYLKTDATESQHIFKWLENIALAHCRINFKLISQGKVVYNLAAAHNLAERLSMLLGSKIAENTLPLFYEGLDFQIHGFLGKPNLARSSRQSQYLFINGRPIQNNMIGKAVLEGYHTLLERSYYPWFLINLDLDPLLIDVNVHPRKTEVKFVNPTEVYRKVKEAVAATLNRANLSPAINLSSSIPFQPKLKGTTKPPAHGPSPASYRIPKVNATVQDALDFSADLLEAGAPMSITPKSFPYPRLLGQIHKAYLVLETERGLQLIDQHAAHERIIYNRLMSDLNNKSVASQRMLVPLNLDLSYAEAEVLYEHMPILHSIGFEIERLSGNTFLLSGVPEVLKEQNLQEIMWGLVSDLSGLEKIHTLNSLQEKIINYLACRSAVKFNDNLTPLEQEKLVQDVRELNIQSCPHGRPVSVELTKDELLKFFKRK